MILLSFELLFVGLSTTMAGAEDVVHEKEARGKRRPRGKTQLKLRPTETSFGVKNALFE